MDLNPLNIEQLPDDVLVMVMNYLSMDELLVCRLVCKRLGELALHWDVWRHRRVLGRDLWTRPELDQDPCQCAVLRLAPCLSVLVCRYGRVHCASFATTKCAIEKLVITVEQGIHPAEFALMVRNQEALGRLKYIVVGSIRDAPGNIDVLWQTLALSSCLVALSIWSTPTTVTLPYNHGPFSSSLQCFSCALTEDSESFVNAVLTWHAPTLEDVYISGSGGYVSERTNDLLASLPKLRTLSCDMLPRLETIAACLSLKDVTLHMSNTSPIGILMERALKFLCRANQLHSLSIDFVEIYQRDGAPLLCDTLVGALPQVRSLKRLSVKGLSSLQPLIRVLPRLNSLLQLKVSTPTFCQLLENDELLLAITPATAPALRRLVLMDEDREYCGHAWLHRDAVKQVLTANPSLHIHLLRPRACKRKRCWACAQDCLPESKLWDLHDIHTWCDGLVVFMHEPHKCPSPEDHAIPADARSRKIWVWVHVPCN